jgi:hypothetical protein
LQVPALRADHCHALQLNVSVERSGELGGHHSTGRLFWVLDPESGGTRVAEDRQVHGFSVWSVPTVGWEGRSLGLPNATSCQLALTQQQTVERTASAHETSAANGRGRSNGARSRGSAHLRPSSRVWELMIDGKPAVVKPWSRPTP